MTGRFTGRHAALVIGGGFAIVLAVNFTMATLAARSHPGMVVKNSYIASQHFNEGLEAGRAQKALGWTVTADARGDALIVDATSSLDQPLTGVKATAALSHPLGRGQTRELVLAEVAPGRYDAPHGMQPGQWIAEIRLTRGSERYYLEERLVIGG